MIWSSSLGSGHLFLHLQSQKSEEKNCWWHHYTNVVKLMKICRNVKITICNYINAASYQKAIPLHSSIRISIIGRWEVMSSRTHTSPIRLLEVRDNGNIQVNFTYQFHAVIHCYRQISFIWASFSVVLGQKYFIMINQIFKFPMASRLLQWQVRSYTVSYFHTKQ